MRIIESLWNEYRKHQDRIPPILLSRYKKTFFSAIEGFFNYLQSLPVNTPQDTEEQIVKMIKEELQLFKERNG